MKTWQFNLYRYNKATGALLDSMLPAPDPAGWDDLEMTVKRADHHGLVRGFSLPLNWTGTAYTFLKTAVNADGIDAWVEIDARYNTDAGYVSFYRGRADFNNYSEDKGVACSVGFKPITPEEVIKSRAKQKIDLFATPTGLDGASLSAYTKCGYNMTLHSQVVPKLSRWKGEDPGALAKTDPLVGSGIGFTVLTPDPGTLLADETGDAATPTVIDSLGVANHAYWTNTTGAAVDVVVKSIAMTLKASVTVGTGTYQIQQVRLYAGNSTSPPVTSAMTLIATGTAPGIFNPGTTVVSMAIPAAEATFTVPAGDSIYIGLRCDVNSLVGGTSNVAWSFPNSELEIIELSIGTDSTCKVAAANEALSRVVETITNGEIKVLSDFLGRTNSQPYTRGSNGCGAFLAFTNGINLRNYPLAKCSVSLEELWSSLNALYALGWQIEANPAYPGVGEKPYIMRVEPAEYFYNAAATALTLNAVGFIEGNIDRKLAIDKFYQKIEIGYRKYNDEQLGGAYEFNTNRELSSPIKAHNGTYKAESPAIGAGNTLELTRREKYLDKASRDYRYDNDVFVIATTRVLTTGQPEMLTAEKNENFTGLAGIYRPDLQYNIRLSPPRMLRRHVKLIAIGLKTGDVLRQTYADYNDTEASTDTVLCSPDLSSAVLKASGYTIAANEALHKPFTYTFSAPVSDAEWAAILAGTTGKVVVNTDNGTITGFIQEIKRKPNMPVAQITLLEI